MTDADLLKQAEQLEKQQQELMDKAIEQRNKANSLAKRIKDLEAEKATADKAAAAADRSIDTHYKCMAGGILFEVMRKDLLSASAKAEIVKLFHQRVPKITDRAEIKRRYGDAWDTLPDKPEAKTPAAAAPKCQCGATMVRGNWRTSDVPTKGWKCPSAFGADGKRQVEHDMKPD